MLSFIWLALCVAVFLWFLPVIIAFTLTLCAVVVCLFMAAVCWVKEQLFPGKSAK